LDFFKKISKNKIYFSTIGKNFNYLLNRFPKNQYFLIAASLSGSIDWEYNHFMYE